MPGYTKLYSLENWCPPISFSVDFTLSHWNVSGVTIPRRIIERNSKWALYTLRSIIMLNHYDDSWWERRRFVKMHFPTNLLIKQTYVLNCSKKVCYMKIYRDNFSLFNWRTHNRSRHPWRSNSYLCSFTNRIQKFEKTFEYHFLFIPWPALR